ncbi:MAG: VCBS repeat-containing protein [Verrucomicrobiota bacterium JB022]|nr:VCBS repeat-containing protein [Verrucomicrobiota bacterium JB022]
METDLSRPRRAARALLALALAATTTAQAADFERIGYHNPGMLVDLGVGLWAWPLPMDYDGDGLIDMVVACTDKPSNGIYYFRNSGTLDPQTGLPVFEAAERLGKAVGNPQISYVDGQPLVTSPNTVYPDFKETGFEQGVTMPAPEQVFTQGGEKASPFRIRANHWRYVDFEGDGAQDLVVGIGFWGDYGWDNAYNAQGEWTHGPLRGYVYLLRNEGTTEQPRYAEPVRLQAGGADVDVYGNPNPSFADFDGDGDLDLICGEFRDSFTYFENVGTRESPRYAAGKKLQANGKDLHMDLCMINPVAVDFNGDGWPDLVVGDEDGRVALVEHTGTMQDGLPLFKAPRYFRQFADEVKFGALSSPVSVDWDGDGLPDILTGNTAGYIGFIKNMGGNPPRWAPPVHLTAGGKEIREMAGPNGSIQGPAEAKWGYSNLSVGDWDGDGLLDILENGIWGYVTLYRNVGSAAEPALAPGERLTVEWPGKPQKPAWNWWTPEGDELVVQWRSTPAMVDLNEDGLMDLVTLDAEGYLALYERFKAEDGTLKLHPPRRVFQMANVSEFDSSGLPIKAEGERVAGPLIMNSGIGGRSGRRTFCFVDWDQDGVRDILMNSQPNVSLLKGLGQKDGQWHFRYEGPLSEQVLAGHSTTPTIVDWDEDGVPDLLLGAEDGFFYYLRNPASAR